MRYAISGFDFAWEDKTNVALRALREAADRWATGGRDAVGTGEALAVLMQILARPHRGLAWMPLWPPRFFGPDCPEPPAFADSCRALTAGPVGLDSAPLSCELEAALGSAADLWAMGDPERPDTRSVLYRLLDLLWAHRIGPRPPSKAYPRGV